VGHRIFFGGLPATITGKWPAWCPWFSLRFSVSIDALDASTPVHAAQGLRGGVEATSRQVATSSSKKKRGGRAHQFAQGIPEELVSEVYLGTAGCDYRLEWQTSWKKTNSLYIKQI